MDALHSSRLAIEIAEKVAPWLNLLDVALEYKEGGVKNALGAIIGIIIGDIILDASLPLILTVGGVMLSGMAGQKIIETISNISNYVLKIVENMSSQNKN